MKPIDIPARNVNYWLDRTNGRIHYAMVMLVDVGHPDTPYLVTNVPTLLYNERFAEVPCDSPMYPQSHVDINRI